jgi:hypothetical protein
MVPASPGKFAAMAVGLSRWSAAVGGDHGLAERGPPVQDVAARSPAGDGTRVGRL